MKEKKIDLDKFNERKLIKKSIIFLVLLSIFAILSILFWALYYHLTSNKVFLVLYYISVPLFIIFGILYLVIFAKMKSLDSQNSL